MSLARVFAFQIWCVVLFSICPSLVEAATFYVSPFGDGSNGLSWDTAFPTVGEAVLESASGDPIHIANGIYREKIELDSGDILIGGFTPDNAKGIAPLSATRTVLDASGLEGRTLFCDFVRPGKLRNLVIRGGRTEDEGAGLYADDSYLDIHDCTFEENVSRWTGGAFYIKQSRLTMNRCVIQENVTTDLVAAGGYLDQTIATLTNCVWTRNQSRTTAGVSMRDCSPTFVNCLFYNNFNPDGRTFNCGSNAQPRLIHSVIAYNQSVTGPGAIGLGFDTMPILRNCIIYSNGVSEIGTFQGHDIDVEYSLLKERTEKEGVIEGDPLFVDPEGGDFRLLPDSPCIDSGAPILSGLDFGDRPRPIDIPEIPNVLDPGHDMGAFEFQFSELPCVQSATLVVESASPPSFVVSPLRIKFVEGENTHPSCTVGPAVEDTLLLDCEIDLTGFVPITGTTPSEAEDFLISAVEHCIAASPESRIKVRNRSGSALTLDGAVPFYIVVESPEFGADPLAVGSLPLLNCSFSNIADGTPGNETDAPDSIGFQFSAFDRICPSPTPTRTPTFTVTQTPTPSNTPTPTPTHTSTPCPNIVGVEAPIYPLDGQTSLPRSLTLEWSPQVENRYTGSGGITKVLKSLATPEKSSIGLEWAFGHLFVSNDRRNEIFEIDPFTGEVLNVYPELETEFVNDIAWDGEKFWGCDASTIEIFSFNSQGIIERFDANFFEGGRPVGITWDGVHLWVLDTSEFVHKIDINTGEVLQSFPGPGERLAGLCFDGFALWTNARDAGKTVRFSRKDGRVLDSFSTPETRQGNNGFGLAFDGQHLWVLHYDEQKIHRVDVGFQEACVDGFEVLFGTTNPPTDLLCDSLFESSCPHEGLDPQTEYFWSVVSRNCCGFEQGPVWSFTTGGATYTPTPTLTPTRTFTPSNTPLLPFDYDVTDRVDAEDLLLGIRFHLFHPNASNPNGLFEFALNWHNERK